MPNIQSFLDRVVIIRYLFIAPIDPLFPERNMRTWRSLIKCIKQSCAVQISASFQEEIPLAIVLSLSVVRYFHRNYLNTDFSSYLHPQNVADQTHFTAQSATSEFLLKEHSYPQCISTFPCRNAQSPLEEYFFLGTFGTSTLVSPKLGTITHHTNSEQFLVCKLQQ